MAAGAAADDPFAALLAAVEAEPHAHDFYALMRRIEALHPQLPRWGEAARPSQEPLRLGQQAELDFAPAALAGLERAPFGPPRLGVRFFGLLGPHGPMPLHLTEYTRERIRHRNDPTLARFLDLFHHRMLLLFYRAWAQSQPAVQHDRPAEDRFADWLGSAFGHRPVRGGAAEAADRARLFHAGQLASRSRHPEGLAKLLASRFDVPVRILANVPQWLAIDAPERSRLGVSRSRPQPASGIAARLGERATAGHKVRDRQFRFRIVLGPMGLVRYLGFLPGAPDARRLAEWVQQAIGFDLIWDVQLCLARAEIPRPGFGAPGRLGIANWLGSAGGRPPAADRADLRVPGRAEPQGRWRRAMPPAG